MSRNDGRVSPSRTKPSLLVPRSSWRTTNAVRSPGGTVRPALMPGKRSVSLTDEVPRSSSFHSISCIYKAMPKGFSYAPEAGTATPWPRPQGCLQRHSTPSSFDVGKAKPQSDSSGSASSWDKLASAKKQSLTPGPALRTVPPRGEKSCPVGADSRFFGQSSVLHRNRTRPRVVGVAQCGKSARWSNMRNRPHCDNGEGVASASPLPTERDDACRASDMRRRVHLQWAGQRGGRSAENVSRIERGVDRGSLSPQRGEGRGEGCEQWVACEMSLFIRRRRRDVHPFGRKQDKLP
jgi:hypothetical protein